MPKLLSEFKKNKVALPIILGSILCYYFFAYHLVRTEYIKLLSLYIALFFLFYKLLANFKNNLAFLSYTAFVFRAVFILAIPNLSQDFYRFIWDGRMLIEGFNPYLNSVEFFISNDVFPIQDAQLLFEGMGTLNASHFSNYPPINQWCFAVANLISSIGIIGSVIGLRLIIIAADFGTLFFGRRLLKSLNIPEHRIFWYILNPFIIIELTGNLHFEGVMIFFLILSLYLLQKNKWEWAAIALALSISTKLIPLIFLPLFYQWFTKQEPKLKGYYNLIKFYGITLLIVALLFFPFKSNAFFENYSTTVALWFQNFEFNASIYYFLREIGYKFRGYNEIAIIGKLLAGGVFIFVLIIALIRNNKTIIKLITAMLIALSFYYFTATTVHPWYLATLLILSVFTKYRFTLIWSFVIILSYLAYININSANKSENLCVIALEYAFVYGYFIWELTSKKKLQNY